MQREYFWDNRRRQELKKKWNGKISPFCRFTSAISITFLYESLESKHMQKCFSVTITTRCRVWANWSNRDVPLKQMKFLFDPHIAFLSLSIDSPSIVFRVCLNWKSNDTKRNTIATKALVFTPFSKFPFYFCALLSAIHQQMAFSQFPVTLKMKFYCQSLDNLKNRQAFLKIYPNKRLAL